MAMSIVAPMFKPPPTHSSASGFTILELMVAVAIFGILLGVGVPSFTTMIRNNRLVDQTNALVSSLNAARSAAYTRGSPVTICAANAGQTNCAGALDSWDNGWIIFTDRDTAGLVDGTDQVIETWPPIASGLRFQSGNVGFVRFAADGMLMTGAVTFDLQPTHCSGDNHRQIVLLNTGRVNKSKGACT